VRRVLPDPFFVIATQNPIESAGTYPLPEAQLDRFAVRFGLGYVSADEEVAMLSAQGATHPIASLSAVASLDEVLQVRRAVTQVRISEAVRRYIVGIVGATRKRGPIRLGASPRASLALQRLSQALALIDGEDFVTPDHVREMVVPALSHRITLDSHSQFSGLSSSEAVRQTLREVAVPA
jgi:MoxR-like ATPase